MRVFLHFFDETLCMCEIRAILVDHCPHQYISSGLGQAIVGSFHVKQLYLTAGGVRRRWRLAKPGNNNKLSTLRDSTSPLCVLFSFSKFSSRFHRSECPMQSAVESCCCCCPERFQKLSHRLHRCTDDDPLLAADLHRPYRLEQWADGISDGHTPSCHNNAGLDCLPFHLVGALATIS